MTHAADENIPFYRNWHELIKPEKLETDKDSHTNSYAKIICQPLERGFATTIGNSLRRILLSSIQGAAITTVKIEGALHEFTTLKDVMEDVSEIILNIKQIRLKLNCEEAQKIVVEKTGAGKLSDVIEASDGDRSSRIPRSVSDNPERRPSTAILRLVMASVSRWALPGSPPLRRPGFRRS